MTNKDFLKNLSTDGFSYADSHQRYDIQLPLMFSYPTSSGSRDPNDLFKDNAEYLSYPSGVHQTVVVTNQQDRYGSFTITSSGAFSVYLQVAEYAVDSSPAFIGSPVIISGEGGTNDLFFATYYDDTPPNPHAYTISIENVGTHSIVFPSPVTSRAFIVTHSGSAPYSISQLLPRKLVQRYDIEVNSIKAYHVSSTLIDTIALQVSDSIVVGSGLIGEKSIDGAKIVDGTISGVLITNGTVTGNKVQAGTISGVLITAGTITGDKIQAATISGALITAGTITADNISTRTITADKIVLSGITADLLGPEAVTAAALASGAVISGKLGVNSVLANNITAGVIQGYHVAANTISGDKIQANTISGALMTAGTITFDKIASNTLTSGQIADGTITGQNILSGTISGVLITDGTIAASKIQANTITANQIAAGTITGTNIAASTISGSLISANTITSDKLFVNQLDAIAANMGTLTVNSGITIGTNGYLWAGSGSASSPTTGLKIYTTSGVSRLTTYNAAIKQLDIDTTGALNAGANSEVVLNSGGLNLNLISLSSPNTDSGRYWIDTTGLSSRASMVKFTYKPLNKPTGYFASFYNSAGGTDRAYAVSQAGNASAGATKADSSEALNVVTAFSLANSEVTLYAEQAFETKTQFTIQTVANENNSFFKIKANVADTGEKVLVAVQTGLTVTEGIILNTDTSVTGTLDVSSNFKVNNNKFTVVPGNGNTNIAGTLDVAGDVHLGTGNHTMKFDASTGNATFDGIVTAAGFNVTGAGLNNPSYGSGADGAVSFDGTNVDYSFATYSASVYTLTRDVFATTLSVSSGITVKTAGFRIFASTGLTVDGNINNDGGNASTVTAGAAAAGGYFKASIAGAAGLGTGVGTSVGATPTAPTSATFVGTLGGRGACAPNLVYNAISTPVITYANLVTAQPAAVDGGRMVINSAASWNTRALATATALWQMTPSLGGASGSKSVAGTSATSGAGGGGGGFVFVATPRITGVGKITAKGGAGGNAAGTGGNFGGGGGGGGGLIGVITDHANYNSAYFDVSGGAGGTSVSNNNAPIATNYGQLSSTTTTTNIFYADSAMSRKTLYVLAINTLGTVGSVPSVSSITGASMTWITQGNILYSSTTSPTRRLEIWMGYNNDNIGDVPSFYSDDPRVIIKFNSAPVSVQYQMDAIYNSSIWQNNPYYLDALAQNITNSATTLTTDLGYAPAAAVLTYSILGAAGGTTFSPGTGNTVIQGSARNVMSMASRARQTNSWSWTGAAAAAMITYAIPPGSIIEPGANGENGKVVVFLV